MKIFDYLKDGVNKRRHFKKIKAAFTALFAQTNGHLLSLNARKETNTDRIAWFYGEIEFDGFNQILKLAQPIQDSVFYDLGAGVGKPVIAAALLYPFKKCVGIELFAPLTQAAQTISQELLHEYRHILPNPQIEIHIIQSDFININLSDADLIFINATCYIGDNWLRIQQQLAQQLRVGAKVILTTKTITLPSFELLHQKVFMMGWGESIISIYKKNK